MIKFSENVKGYIYGVFYDLGPFEIWDYYKTRKKSTKKITGYRKSV